MNRLLFVLTAALASSPAPAADWGQFRGPGGLGVSPETGLPVRWSATENVRWKVDLPGRGLSCPVVAGGRVYVTACTGFEQGRLHVLCFEAASGKKLWERQFWATGTTLCHAKTCMAAPTPAADGQRVYALFATNDLACLDRDGNLLWYRSLARDHPTLGNNVGMAASPILWQDLLILALENTGESFGLAVDKHTGKNRWKVERSRAISWASPAVIDHGGRPEVLFQGPQNVSAHDPATGRRLWTYTGKGLADIPTPVSGNGLVYLAAGGITALRPGTDAEPPRPVWQVGRLQPGFATPLLYRDRLYTVSSVGILSCAEASTGKLLWKERLEGPFSASPVVGDGKLYLVSEKGQTTVVRPGDKPHVLATNELGETFLATPAIAGGALYLRSDEHLYCIAEKKD
jgi:outer membrane protein assembly factor BamB